MPESSAVLWMPVYVVDDEIEQMTWVHALRDALMPTEVLAFRTMAEAETEMLREPQNPFLLIMDYDFEKNAEERTQKGDAFVAGLRRQHIYGPSLPVLMLSGRINDRGRIEIGQHQSWKAPSAFAEKDLLSAGVGIPENFEPPFDRGALAAPVGERLEYLIAILVQLQAAFEEQRAIETALTARADSMMRKYLEEDELEDLL